MTYQIVETIPNGDTDKATYHIVDDSVNSYGEPSPYFSLVVAEYCRLSGENPDAIDSAHSTVYRNMETAHITTIDQHIGNHEPSGLPEMRLLEVRTALSDYIPTADFERMSPQEQEECLTELAIIHDAMVALESLDCDRRATAKEWLTDNQGCDFPSVASLVRRAIQESA